MTHNIAINSNTALKRCTRLRFRDMTLNLFFSQEKLREERNKEYKLFLQEKAKTGRLKRAIPPVTSKVMEIINI